MPSPRLFATHAIRPVEDLCPGWTFHFPRTGTQLAPESWAEGQPEAVPVPGVWEMTDARKSYRGQAVARREFSMPQAGPLRLEFQGVSHTVRVLIDGHEVGRHHNAFTPFAVAVPQVEAGAHELLLHISNEHGELSALHVPNDYYNYGGISRPAELQRLRSPVFIERVRCTPRPTAQGYEAELEIELHNLGAEPRQVGLEVRLAGGQLRVQGYRAGVGATRARFVMRDLPEARAWSPEDPALFDLAAWLELDSERGVAVDDWRDRVGFREFKVVGPALELNGRPIRLLGFNRHEDHIAFGCALPLEQLREDVALMRSLGANAVRTSHYPNDARFLDLCDEAGLLVWEENHARGLVGEAFRHPRFRQQCEDCNREMVLHHHNHPSIVLWGILNECESHTDLGRACYREQFEQIRRLDPSRPTTYASCQHQHDCCQDLPDVVGWNIYSRWYGNMDPREDLDALIARMEPRGLAGRPLIVSEFGAGAIPGYRDPVRRAKWSEERQSDILDELLRCYGAHPRVCGLFIWQFCDVRVDESWAMGRPRTMNNKGVVNESRRPKLAAETVRRHFEALGRGEVLP